MRTLPLVKCFLLLITFPFIGIICYFYFIYLQTILNIV
ncbi:hypothetical protein FM106_32135 [Brachybacterium faecium]|nr:hypothetical protein FM106_32135 [Brachybacterium faecium]